MYLVPIKEAMRFEGKQNLQPKAMIVLFDLFALSVERTKEGLAAKVRGKRLGRSKGVLSNSKLDGTEGTSGRF